jgi:hypothetical protein
MRTCAKAYIEIFTAFLCRRYREDMQEDQTSRKDADPDTFIWEQAKAEYSRLTTASDLRRNIA